MDKVQEEKRLIIQRDLDQKKTAIERNRLGQYSTPTQLANEILEYGLFLEQTENKVTFLDPAIGTGAFYSALINQIGDKTVERAKGFEVDEHYGEPAKELWKNYGLDLEIYDFTKTLPPKNGFNLIICNPPYVRHHHLNQEEKKRLKKESFLSAGVNLSGLSGYYCYFLVMSHRWMSENGVAGWLIPSEFMDVNYGTELKRYLLEKVTLVRIHRFDPKEVQFDDALVSSSVVWFKRQKPSTGHTVEFTFGGTHKDPKIRKFIPVSILNKEKKWTRFPQKEERRTTGQPVLSDYFDIKRGIATGSNQYFILTKEKVEKYNIPAELVRPILPSPRNIQEDIVNADDEGNPIVPQPLFLLDCRLPEDEVKKRYPDVWLYLDSIKQELSTKYLCKTRNIWYLQEKRDPTYFVCTYMGRGKEGTERPFRFLLNKSKAIAANSYLLLYPKQSVRREIEKNPELVHSIWKTLNTINSDSLVSEGRVYGGGLHKLEPREMANLPATCIKNLLNTKEFLF